jgi:elongation factor Ts
MDLLKKLRKETAAGVMDCRDALHASGNDIQKAKDWLFERSKITAAKKSGRSAEEGGVSVYVDDAVGVMVELNSETDFVAKEKTFLDVLQSITRAIHQSYPSVTRKANAELQQILDLPLKTTISGFETKQIKDAIQQLTFLYKENIQLRRAMLFPQEETPAPSPHIHLYSYVHNQLCPGIGKIGNIVQIESEGPLTEEEKKTLNALGKIIATQVTGGKPYSIEGKQRMPQVDDAEQCKSTSFEPTLMKQQCILEPGSIQQVFDGYQTKIGKKITLKNFGRWERNCGEEQQAVNLQEEVQKMLKE